MLNEEVRSKMAEEIEEEMKNAVEASTLVEDGPVQLEDILNEANEALVECYAKLKSLEETENFVGLRLRSYRQKLVESHQETVLAEQVFTNEDTLTGEISLCSIEKGGVNNTQKQNAAFQVIQEDLERVEHTHGMIEQSILHMRKQILTLEQKIQETKERQRECNEFVKAVKDLQVKPEGEQKELDDSTNYLQYYGVAGPDGDSTTLATINNNTCSLEQRTHQETV